MVESMTARPARVVARPFAGLLAVMVMCFGLTGCGGSDSDSNSAGTDASSNGATSTTTGDGSSTTTSKGGSTTGKSSGTGAGVISVGDLDLSSSPAAIADRYIDGHRELVYLAHLSSEPKVIAQDVDGQTYSLSPDGTHAAIAHPGDTVRKARLELVDTETGKAQSFEIDANDINLDEWAPDSTAIYVYGTKSSTPPQGVYRVDGTSQVLPTDYVGDSSSSKAFGRLGLPWVHGAAGNSLLDECANVDCSGSRYTMVTSKGVPVTLTTSYAKDRSTIGFGRFDPDTHALVPIAGLDASGTSVGNCGRFGEFDDVLYDSDTDKAIRLPEHQTGCPVISHDGKLAAFATTDDGPVVMDLTSGVVTSIGREGKPVAWSKDDKQVAIWAYDKGAFLVAPDGSGGKEASTPLESSCSIGDTGVLVSQTEKKDTSDHKLVAYDIATDSARALGTGAIGDGCYLSPDRKWVLSGETIIDLAAGKAGQIQNAGSSSSSPAIRVLRWRGSSAVAAKPK